MSRTPALKDIFGERLRRARTMRGLSLRALADELGGKVTYAALGKYEKGQMMPSSGVLLALSKSLGVRPDYFFERQAVTLSGIEFRKKASLGKKKQDQVVEEAQEFFERYLEVESILEIKNPSLPRIDLTKVDHERLPEEAEKAAASVRKEWKLGLEPLANVHELLEDHGVKVKQVDSEDGFNGLSGWAGEVPVIVLANWLDQDLPRKRLTAVHELGHLVMELPEDIDKKEEERLCFRFAGAMLVPKERFLGEFGRERRFGQVSLVELKAMKAQWGISLSAIMRRARDLELITQDHYERFYRTYSANYWHKDEPGEWVGSEDSCRFRQLVHRAAAQELITRSKAAGLLGISLREFDADYGKAG